MVARRGCPFCPALIRQAEFPDPGCDTAVGMTWQGKAGEVALDVGKKNGHAEGAETFGHVLECHGLACAGGSGDQAVAVGHAGIKAEFLHGAVLLRGGCDEQALVGCEHGEVSCRKLRKWREYGRNACCSV